MYHFHALIYEDSKLNPVDYSDVHFNNEKKLLEAFSLKILMKWVFLGALQFKRKKTKAIILSLSLIVFFSSIFFLMSIQEKTETVAFDLSLEQEPYLFEIETSLPINTETMTGIFNDFSNKMQTYNFFFDYNTTSYLSLKGVIEITYNHTSIDQRTISLPISFYEKSDPTLDLLVDSSISEKSIYFNNFFDTTIVENLEKFSLFSSNFNIEQITFNQSLQLMSFENVPQLRSRSLPNIFTTFEFLQNFDQFEINTFNLTSFGVGLSINNEVDQEDFLDFVDTATFVMNEVLNQSPQLMAESTSPLLSQFEINQSQLEQSSGLVILVLYITLVSSILIFIGIIVVDIRNRKSDYSILKSQGTTTLEVVIYTSSELIVPIILGAILGNILRIILLNVILFNLNLNFTMVLKQFFDLSFSFLATIMVLLTILSGIIMVEYHGVDAFDRPSLPVPKEITQQKLVVVSMILVIIPIFITQPIAIFLNQGTTFFIVLILYAIILPAVFSILMIITYRLLIIRLINSQTDQLTIGELKNVNFIRKVRRNLLPLLLITISLSTILLSTTFTYELNNNLSDSAMERVGADLVITDLNSDLLDQLSIVDQTSTSISLIDWNVIETPSQNNESEESTIIFGRIDPQKMRDVLYTSVLDTLNLDEKLTRLDQNTPNTLQVLRFNGEANAIQQQYIQINNSLQFQVKFNFIDVDTVPGAFVQNEMFLISNNSFSAFVETNKLEIDQQDDYLLTWFDLPEDNDETTGIIKSNLLETGRIITQENFITPTSYEQQLREIYNPVIQILILLAVMSTVFMIIMSLLLFSSEKEFVMLEEKILLELGYSSSDINAVLNHNLLIIYYIASLCSFGFIIMISYLTQMISLYNLNKMVKPKLTLFLIQGMILLFLNILFRLTSKIIRLKIGNINPYNMEVD